MIKGLAPAASTAGVGSLRRGPRWNRSGVVTYADRDGVHRVLAAVAADEEVGRLRVDDEDVGAVDGVAFWNRDSSQYLLWA